MRNRDTYPGTREDKEQNGKRFEFIVEWHEQVDKGFHEAFICHKTTLLDVNVCRLRKSDVALPKLSTRQDIPSCRAFFEKELVGWAVHHDAPGES
jgi:hypothetical protein